MHVDAMCEALLRQESQDLYRPNGTCPSYLGISRVQSPFRVMQRILKELLLNMLNLVTGYAL